MPPNVGKMEGWRCPDFRWTAIGRTWDVHAVMGWVLGGGLQDFSVLGSGHLGLIWVLNWVGLGWEWTLGILGLKG